MTVQNTAALFTAMLVLAAIPSISVLTVVSSAIASGTTHGLLTALGIVTGDLLFIVFTLYGLAVITTQFSALFWLLKLLGGAYLVWLGMCLYRDRTASDVSKALSFSNNHPSSKLSSFLSGLFITIGDQKVVLFYAGFLPSFVDISTLSSTDVAVLLLSAALAVGSVKACYAYAANRARRLFKGSISTWVNTAAALTLCLLGLHSILAVLYRTLSASSQ